MLKKVMPLVFMGMAAQSYTHKGNKKMNDAAFDMRKKRLHEEQDKKIKKEMAKKKLKKAKEKK